MKYSFFDDYSEGAHPRILEALVRTNLDQEMGYGEDSLSAQAAALIKKKVADPGAAVHFVVSGMQANLVCLSSMFHAPYESLIAPVSAHINVDEAGAIEATGHKVNTVASKNGKLTPADIVAILEENTDEHKVKPRVVAISQATEWGTVYSKEELRALSQICKKNDLYLYVDGARLGSALMSQKGEMDIAEFARYVDMFYIGGTKNGALLGEAIVIMHPELQDNFRRHMKQRAALLAKSRLLGLQFLELFKDDLFFDLAEHANLMARKLHDAIGNLGYTFLSESNTNQLFPVLPTALIEQLKPTYGFHPYGFYSWTKAQIGEDSSAIRLVTSWATKEEAVDAFIADLKKLSRL